MGATFHNEWLLPRLTHKITAIGIVGVIGVVLVGAVHLYGETAMAAYRDAAVSRSSGPRPNDSLRPSIANLNIAGGGAFDFLISTPSIGPAT